MGCNKLKETVGWFFKGGVVANTILDGNRYQYRVLHLLLSSENCDAVLKCERSRVYPALGALGTN